MVRSSRERMGGLGRFGRLACGRRARLARAAGNRRGSVECRAAGAFATVCVAKVPGVDGHGQRAGCLPPHAWQRPPGLDTLQPAAVLARPRVGGRDGSGRQTRRRIAPSVSPLDDRTESCPGRKTSAVDPQRGQRPTFRRVPAVRAPGLRPPRAGGREPARDGRVSSYGSQPPETRRSVYSGARGVCHGGRGKRASASTRRSPRRSSPGGACPRAPGARQASTRRHGLTFLGDQHEVPAAPGRDASHRARRHAHARRWRPRIGVDERRL